jgi:hypothetical protein
LLRIRVGDNELLQIPGMVLGSASGYENTGRRRIQEEHSRVVLNIVHCDRPDSMNGPFVALETGINIAVAPVSLQFVAKNGQQDDMSLSGLHPLWGAMHTC